MKKINTSGKRKRAIARATACEGTGIIRINNILLDNYPQKMYRLKLREPLLLAGSYAQKINVDVTVDGGGINGQAEAARLAIAKALVELNKGSDLKERFLEYDRNFLVADVRRKEPAKPNRHGQARAKVQKSYR